jgi:mono/diheme cytochrome c family protein
MNKVLSAILLLLFLASPMIGTAQNGEALFETCAACHTIGGGQLVGPDLANVDQRRSEDWLLRFIRSSQSMVKSGDPEATKIFNEYKIPMPDHNFTDAEITSIIDYIVSQSPGREPDIADAESASDTTAGGGAADTAASADSQAPAETTIAGRSLDSATEADVDLGSAYFSGSKRLANGGPSCISCHALATTSIISGGALAKDLTDAFQRFGGTGLAAYIRSPQLQPMTKAFETRPLTEEEIYSLVAFMKDVSANPVPTPTDYRGKLALAGLFGGIGLLGVYGLLWIRRKRATVHKSIFKRQIHAE